MANKPHVKLPQTLEITAATYDQIAHDNNVITLDVRTKTENLTLASLPWAINAPISDLIKNPTKYLKEPDDEQIIVTVCNSGNRSHEAAEWLRSQKYINTYVLDGGIYGYERWKKSQEQPKKWTLRRRKSKSKKDK